MLPTCCSFRVNWTLFTCDTGRNGSASSPSLNGHSVRHKNDRGAGNPNRLALHARPGPRTSDLARSSSPSATELVEVFLLRIYEAADDVSEGFLERVQVVRRPRPFRFCCVLPQIVDNR